MSKNPAPVMFDFNLEQDYTYFPNISQKFKPTLALRWQSIEFICDAEYNRRNTTNSSGGKRESLRPRNYGSYLCIAAGWTIFQHIVGQSVCGASGG
jgi:hypothetical protein